MNSTNYTKGSYKILIGPTEIAGYYRGLANGMQTIGLDCDYFTYRPHPFDYGGESSEPRLLKLAKFGLKAKADCKVKTLNLLFLTPLAILLLLPWTVFAAFKYDVFIFGFGESLLPRNIDLPILKLMNKKVISVLFHGSEARPAFINGSIHAEDGTLTSVEEIAKSAAATKNKVTFHSKHTSIIVGSPLSTSQFCDKKFINGFILGVPTEPPGEKKPVSSGKNIKNRKTQRRYRVLHSPSHMAVKGTKIITECVERLNQRGFLIDLVTIRGRANSDVIEQIKMCDFAIDQLYSDTPMGGFAAECAWLGKPAIVGGYGWDEISSHVPPDMMPPSKTCHPDEITQAIESLITSAGEIERLGLAASEFVTKKWEKTEVARKFQRLIEDDIPDAWWVEPKEIKYLYGIGQSLDQTIMIIQEMITKLGVESLSLSHRPVLEKEFLALVNSTGKNETDA